MMPQSSVRESTWAERSTWGECPVCAAPNGQPCDPDQGIPLGRNINGDVPRGGVHLARLQRAPSYVELVPARQPKEQTDGR